MAKQAEAKISVSLDTEAAEAKLDKVEKRLKEDDKQLKKTERTDKQKGQRQKKAANARRGRMRGVLAGGAAGAAASVIPFAQMVSAASVVLEYGGDKLIKAMDAGMKAALPSGAFFKDMREGIVQSMDAGLKALSERITEIKAAIDATAKAKDSIVDVVKASTGLGAAVDENFLIEHALNVFKIGFVQSRLQEDIKKATWANIGVGIEKTFAKMTGG